MSFSEYVFPPLSHAAARTREKIFFFLLGFFWLFSRFWMSTRKRPCQDSRPSRTRRHFLPARPHHLVSHRRRLNTSLLTPLLTAPALSPLFLLLCFIAFNREEGRGPRRPQIAAPPARAGVVHWRLFPAAHVAAGAWLKRRAPLPTLSHRRVL